MSTRNLQVYSNGAYVDLSPAPFVGISDSFNRNEAGFLNQETTITLDGYAISDSAACGTAGRTQPVPPVCKGSNQGRGSNAGANVAQAQTIREKFGRGREISVRLADAGGYVHTSLNQCFVESVNIEQGDWSTYVKYQVVLKSYTGQDCNKNSAGAANISLCHGASAPLRLTPRDSGVITDYSESFNIEPIVGDYGASGQGLAGEPKVGSIYYKGSSSVSVSAKSLGNRRVIGCGGNGAANEDTGWQIARDLFSELHGDPSNPSRRRQFLLNNGLFSYDSSQTTYGNTVGFEMYNLTRRQSIDVHTGTFSITDDFIIAPTGSTALETWNISYDSSNDSSSPTVSVQGTIKGLTQMSVDAQTRNYTELGTTPNSGAIDAALSRYHEISNNLDYGVCDLYTRAQTAAPHNLNSGPVSISFSTNDITGEVSYTVTYDARPYNFFTGVLTESINVEDTLPGDSYTTIPILGRPTGPILQYLYGRTEYRRTLSIDLLFDSAVVGTAVTFPTGDRSNLLSSKPSIRAGFKEQLASLISAYSPAYEDGILNWMQDPPVETWNQSECRYTCTVSWIYELNK